MSDKQAVAEQTDVESQSQTEGAADARDDLDKALDEFQVQGEEPTQAEQTDDVSKRVEALEAAHYRDNFNRDIGNVVNTLRGDLSAETFDDDLVVGYLDSRARNDPRIGAAWANRHQNPDAFKKALGALSKDFQKKFGSQIDQNATEDREAMAAAVRSASTATAEQPDKNWAGMSQNEFEQEKIKLGWRPY